jgi:hypothetical protein
VNESEDDEESKSAKINEAVEIEEVKGQQQEAEKDFFSALMQFIAVENIQDAERAKEAIATVETRAHIKASEYLAFGAIHHTPLNA